jgi:hypothetical protein
MAAAARLLRLLLALLLSAAARMAPAALPPGRAPFGSVLLPQPVLGAARGATAESWRRGKLCDVSRPPFSLRNASNGTAALQLAIDTCGDLPDGGTVLVPRGLVLLTGSLWLRSNLTLRVEGALLGTATGSMATAASIADAPDGLHASKLADGHRPRRSHQRRALPADETTADRWRRLR